MFLLDDVLLAPGKAAFVLFQELARKAQEEWLNDDTVKQDLQQLYEMLESGRISDKDFEAQECRLLERLEQIARIKFQDKWGTQVPAAEGPVVEQQIVVTPLDALASPPPTPTPPLAVTPPPVAASFAPPAINPFVALEPPPPLYTAPPPTYAPVVTPPPAYTPPPPPADTPPPLTYTPPAVTHTPAPAAWSPVAPPPTTYTPIAPPTPAPPGGALTMNQVIDCAVRALAVLKMRVSTITSVMPEEDNWRVTVELVERRGIPDTNDVLGLYELRLDKAGNVLRYERTQMRRRCDFSR